MDRRYPAKVLKVIDGDTLEVLIDLGYHIFRIMRVRLAGINCPETHGEERPEGLKAKEFVRRLVEGRQIEIISRVESDKYGRNVADVILGDGRNLSQVLLKNNLAVVFMPIVKLL